MLSMYVHPLPPPFFRFQCDSCDRWMSPREAFLEWVEMHNQVWAFAIIHQAPPPDCVHRGFELAGAISVDLLLGADGRARLLALLAKLGRMQASHPIRHDEFVRIFARLQIPWFEYAYAYQVEDEEEYVTDGHYEMTQEGIFDKLSLPPYVDYEGPILAGLMKPCV